MVCVILLLTRCINQEERAKNKDQAFERATDISAFAGSKSCASCHKDIYETHIQTGHFLSTIEAKEEYIKGSFVKGENIFPFTDKVSAVMEKREDGLYQTAYINGEKKREQRFDIVVGSGSKGQSFLHWKGDELVQMPITYFTSANEWSNSPGYPGKLVFDRPITSRCLECHTTYVEKLSDIGHGKETFNKASVILGVDCERCHGPAAKHVEFFKNGGDSSMASLINIASLSRQQQLDMCAVCHGGRLNKTAPSFSFQTGDRLSDYFVWDTITGRPEDIDVHGNQFGMLSASKCFVASDMTCGSCHSPHQNERNSLQVFSQRCINCHTSSHVEECGMTKEIGSTITSNCVDCHMPKQPSKAIAVYLSGSTTASAALLRSHVIKIYPENSKSQLKKMPTTKN
jgi:mono/diheme cytochrome c family protein